MLEIRKAAAGEYGQVVDFYYNLIDALAQTRYKPGWKKEIYPTRESLREAIARQELYVGTKEGQILSSMILNHACHEDYSKVSWHIQAEDREILVIHALGVHPAFSRQGLAKEMVQKAIETAEKEQAKTIRLDVLEGNLPAEKAYLKMGFQYCGTVKMFYPDTGLADYRLFDLKIRR